MFGYIAPVLSGLTGEQKNRYHEIYCGLCRALKKKHGQSGRISLSNDMTFLAMLLSSLYEPDSTRSSGRCAVHPLKQNAFLSSSMIDYAADMNALLFYYKCVDQRMDDRSLSAKAAERIFRSKAASVRTACPMQEQAVRESLASLWEEEKKEVPNPDLLCNLSGTMLGAVFVPFPEDPWSTVLKSVGESLGRFIYWMDAWEDREEDLKKNRFNPLQTYSGKPDYEDFCRETLELLIAEAVQYFEVLPLEQDLDLMRNILYSGVWQRYRLRQMSQKRKEGAHAE